jgi:hypothetical protein
VTKAAVSKRVQPGRRRVAAHRGRGRRILLELTPKGVELVRVKGGELEAEFAQMLDPRLDPVSSGTGITPAALNAICRHSPTSSSRRSHAMNRRLLVIVGTLPIPSPTLAESYVSSARAAGAEVRLIDLAHDPIPDHPRTRDQLRAPRVGRTDDLPLDPDVARYLDDLFWADHIAIFHPAVVGHRAGSSEGVHRPCLPLERDVPLSRTLCPVRPPARRTHGTHRHDDGLSSVLEPPRLPRRRRASLSRATLGYCGVRTVGITLHARALQR